MNACHCPAPPCPAPPRPALALPRLNLPCPLPCPAPPRPAPPTLPHLALRPPRFWPYNKLLSLLFEDELLVAKMHTWYHSLVLDGAEAASPHVRIKELTVFQRLILIR